MCAGCVEKWAGRPVDPNDDLLPLSHPVMRDGLRDWNEKYGRTSDAELLNLAKGARTFERNERRAGGRA